MHCHLAERGLVTQSHIHPEARSCTPELPTVASRGQAKGGILDKATLTLHCSPGRLAYFLLPSTAPSGN